MRDIDRNSIENQLASLGEVALPDCRVENHGNKVVAEVKQKSYSVIREFIPDAPRELLEGLEGPTAARITDAMGMSARDLDTGAIQIEKPADLALAEFGKRISHIPDLYRDVHLIRIFGSYVLIRDHEAVYASETPIRYCPLMFRLLSDIGGKNARRLLDSFKKGDADSYREQLLSLVDEIVLGSGTFAPDRSLNVCERHVKFGASEIMADAMDAGRLDCAAIVSNAIGSVLTFDGGTTQGVVKTMSGLFFTTPDSRLVGRCYEEGIYPVFPLTGDIDPLKACGEAIALGCRKIAVTSAANYNGSLDRIAALERDDVTIYRFALCATAVSRETALKMSKYGDIVWSCASQNVRDLVAPQAIMQVGIKIPIYIMSERALDLIAPRLAQLDPAFNLHGVHLEKGANCPVLHTSSGGISVIPASEIRHDCTSCPSPLV